jgi:hypothetical protein
VSTYEDQDYVRRTCEHVIASVDKSRSVNRVVLTSSVAAVIAEADINELARRPVLYEDRYPDESNPKRTPDRGLGYSMGKRVAEDLFAQIRYPALMHCKSGADRAGIMAVLYKLLRERVSFHEASVQLSGKYLHIRHGKTGVLDAFLDAYAAYNSGKPEKDWKPFLDWVREDYDRPAIKADFARKLGRGPQLDVLLRRE